MLKTVWTVAFVLFLMLGLPYEHQAYVLDGNVQLFSLKMRIQEVGKILYAHKPLYPKLAPYFTQYFYFFKKPQWNQKTLYYNNSKVQIVQNTLAKGAGVHGKVVLKRVFGIQLGPLSSLENRHVFNSMNRNPKTKSALPAESAFSFRPIYRYFSFPIKKINPLILSISLDFFDQRLAKITYHLQMSDSQWTYFLKHKPQNTSFVLYPKNHVLILKTDPALYSQYQNYVQKTQRFMDTLIEKHRVAPIQAFLSAK